MLVHRLPNPFRFAVAQVTVVIIALHLGLFTGLLYVHHVVPSAPRTTTPFNGVNITEAWLDLQQLSDGFHPYNSHRNDEVRQWLRGRIDDILKRNGIVYETQQAVPNEHASMNHSLPHVILYDDLVSNATYSEAPPISVYFEGTNLMVYVRGTVEDPESYRKCFYERKCKTRAVLVNAHYDSVSTGFGATDDGTGVVSILQLISYFTSPGQRPRRGVLALFNNGEEDYLNGARAFAQHPASHLVDTFLNLEGAGAGGRAMLFRSTDAEVTRAYSRSPHLFGTVLSADAFRNGVVRSSTDYSVFNGNLGLRGLDVAFFEPRASYHTSQDSTRHTNKDSIWHMLSAALETMKGLTSDISADFRSRAGSDAVWFDVFGYGFALITQDVLLIVSILLLVLCPILLVVILFGLRKQDKMYLFARKITSDPLDVHAPDEQTILTLGGWRGFFRFPVAFIVATACCFLLALLLAHINPYIVYSSQYSVWTMMLSAWLVLTWIVSRGVDHLRASALHRAHSLGWIYIVSWLLLVLGTWAQRALHIAGTYGFVLLHAGSFVALCIAYLELFALSSKSDLSTGATNTRASATVLADTDRTSFKRPQSRDESESASRPGSSARRLQSLDAEPTETTSLLSPSSQRRRSSQAKPMRTLPYGDEQAWSAEIPTWTWLLQLAVLCPVVIIFFGPIALLITSATHQTPADGNPVLPIYAVIAILTTILLLPTAPFLHRVHRGVPAFLFLICIGTLIYNATSFPFSESNRLKVYFSQELDLDTGLNLVNLTAVKGYGPKIASTIPSAEGQALKCSMNSHGPRGPGLETCQWRSILPNVVPYDGYRQRNHSDHRSWIYLDTEHLDSSKNEALLTLSGLNTRNCRLKFSTPIFNYTVVNASPDDPRFVKIPKGGVKELRLWSRDWERSWQVHVNFDSSDSVYRPLHYRNDSIKRSLDGRAVCLWNDDNRVGAIPALDELKRFMPSWSIVTKAGDGLLEASKAFSI
ncbi:MAG: hypothetical protein M1828_004985 [Chrysothrix sp. TS-e1954]|nr:MAG: hypothetical protein M1828_004985 [Chrysothrix sp. TS-e1954]